MVTFQEHTHKVIQRAKAFYAAAGPGHYLVNVTIPTSGPPIPPLNGFELPRQLGEWLDLKLEAARPGWAAKAGLDDDSLPAICPSFGIAEHSAWLGMEVRLQATTCLPVPLLHTPQDLVSLQFREQTPWFRMMCDGYAHLASRRDGSFFLSVRGTMSPMDIANALRGDALFADFLLLPEFAHHLLYSCMQAIRWYYPRQLAWADEIAGGHVFSYSGGWMEKPALGHLSNDAAMLCARRIYEEFGFPYECRLAEGYHSILYHVHNEKLHHLPQLTRLPGLALLEITDDPQVLPAIADLPRLLAATGRANLLIHTDAERLRRHIDEVSGRNVFFDVTCQDRQEAVDTIELVRNKSGIK